MASITRAAPMSLFLRNDIEWLSSSSPLQDRESLSSPAQEVVELLEQRGAMFASDIAAATQMLESQLEDVLGELVARGFVTADGFSGLRSLIADKSKESRRNGRRRPGLNRMRMASQSSGRWSLWKPSNSTDIEEGEGEVHDELDADQIVEQWAWQLLRRWGVVFRDLIDREPGSPRWFELLQVYRRLEARGEIRGGRFIYGVAGEQFAVGDTVKRLRQLRDDGPANELVVLSACDPLNLEGVLTDGARVASIPGHRFAIIDGVTVAAFQAGELTWRRELDGEKKSAVSDALMPLSDRRQPVDRPMVWT